MACYVNNFRQKSVFNQAIVSSNPGKRNGLILPTVSA